MCAALVCKDWLKAAGSDSLWLIYSRFLFPGFPLSGHGAPLQKAVQSEIERRKAIYIVLKTGVMCVGVRSKEVGVMEVRELQAARYASWVSLPCGDLLLCGGVLLPEKLYLSTVYRLPHQSPTPVLYPPMPTPRAGGGLLLYQGTTLFVFGGDNPENLTASEKLSLTGLLWTSLPDMLFPRRSFNPALYQTDVYLAGGGGSLRAIEVFHIMEEEYDVLPIALPYIDSLTCCLVVDGELIILVRDKMLAWRLDGEGDVREVAEIQSLYWFSPAGVVTCPGESFISPYYDGAVYRLSHRPLSLALLPRDSLVLAP